jgi:hypothetical protein
MLLLPLSQELLLLLLPLPTLLSLLLLVPSATVGHSGELSLLVLLLLRAFSAARALFGERNEGRRKMR